MVTNIPNRIVTIIRKTLYVYFSVKIFSNNSILKSRGDFRFWTFLKMSNLRNPKIVLKKRVKNQVSELYGLKNRKNIICVVTITFSKII